jgi:hypothetical protein
LGFEVLRTVEVFNPVNFSPRVSEYLTPEHTEFGAIYGIEGPALISLDTSDPNFITLFEDYKVRILWIRRVGDLWMRGSGFNSPALGNQDWDGIVHYFFTNTPG